MASAQFVVYNDAGVEQVSLGGVNLALIQKVDLPGPGSWTPISGPNASGLKYSFTVSAKHPVVAIASNVTGRGGAVFASSTKTGTDQWRIDLFGGASENSGTAVGASTLTAHVVAYVFDVAPPPASGPGLALLDASGNCFFNAAYPCLRVRQMLDGFSNVHGYATSVTPPSGKTYALVQRSSWGMLIVGSVNAITGDRIANEYVEAGSGGLNGATVQFGYGYSCFVSGAISLPHGSSGAVGQTYSTFGCSTGGSPDTYILDGLVIDVTGL